MFAPKATFFCRHDNTALHSRAFSSLLGVFRERFSFKPVKLMLTLRICATDPVWQREREEREMNQMRVVIALEVTAWPALRWADLCLASGLGSTTVSQIRFSVQALDYCHVATSKNEQQMLQRKKKLTRHIFLWLFSLSSWWRYVIWF